MGSVCVCGGGLPAGLKPDTHYPFKRDVYRPLGERTSAIRIAYLFVR